LALGRATDLARTATDGEQEQPMGLFGKKKEMKREVARSAEWSEGAYTQLFEKATRIEDPFARRVAQAAAYGASQVVGGIRMSNSPVAIPDGERTDLALRRAQWALGLVQVRLVAPLDQMDRIVAACVEALKDDSELSADVARLWAEQVSEGAVPEPGTSYDVLLDAPWFRELGMWVIGSASLREEGVPFAAAIVASCVHLHAASRGSVASYAGTDT
jgi:hypothetical protein